MPVVGGSYPIYVCLKLKINIMNFQTMNKQRKFILIAAAAGIISVFLPWVTISMFGTSQSINGFRSWGIIVFFCFVVAGIVAIIGNHSDSLERNLWMISTGSGAVALVSMVINIISSNGIGGVGFADAGIGFGLWISIASAACILLFAWMFKHPTDTLKKGFDGLKKSISIPSTFVVNKNAATVETSAIHKIGEPEK